MGSRGVVFAGVLAALLLGLGLSAPGWAQAPDARVLFQAVLANPTDVAANLRYARAVEAEGDPRKALMAYERILSVEPTHREARLGLRRLAAGNPAGGVPSAQRTELIAGLGLQYESNPRLLDEQRSEDSDIAGLALLRIEDERVLFGQRWKSRANAQGRLYRTFGDGTLGYVGLDTGPVLPVGDWGEVRPLAGIEHARLKAGPLFSSVYGGAEVGLRDAGPLRGVEGIVSYADFSNQFPGRDGFLLRLRPQLTWTGLLTGGDRLTMEPEVTYNAATGEDHQFRYWSLGAAAFYAAPISGPFAGFQQIHAGPEATFEHRRYAGHAAGQDEDRRDWRLSPGLRLIGSGFLEQDLSVVVRYYVDNNRSNEADKEYSNHTVSLVVYRRF